MLRRLRRHWSGTHRRLMQVTSRSGAPRVSFVIPVLNDERNLARCVMAIQAQRGRLPIEIIVLDNGSTDGSYELAVGLGARVMRIPHVRVSALRNEGLRAARAPLVAFVDADNEIAVGWLAAAVAQLEQGPDILAAIGLDYSSPPGGTWVQQVYDRFRRHPSEVESVRWLASGNLAVRRALALNIGGFDESLETCEDVDFCNRLRRRGYQILAHPELQSRHYGDPATLRRLFSAELWRGRDALRVDLRGVTAWAEIPSMISPVIALACMIMGGTGLLLAAMLGREWLWWTGSSALAIAALSALKAARMTRRHSNSFTGLIKVYAVAFVYDVARALALVSRMPHRHATTSDRTDAARAADRLQLGRPR